MIRTLTNSFEAKHANPLHYEAMKKDSVIYQSPFDLIFRYLR